MQSENGWKAFKTHKFNTFKVYMQPHAHKSQNLVINLEQDELILHDDSKLLKDVNVGKDLCFI
jgi:hypothetical protein